MNWLYLLYNCKNGSDDMSFAFAAKKASRNKESVCDA